MGNETGNGENHDQLGDAIRACDPTRILHHEGEVKAKWTQGGNCYHSSNYRYNDLVNPMYPHIDDVVHWAKTNRDKRPFIPCEYSHAMGNSNGNLKEYWELFENCHGLQGGFIWDWVDQGLLISGGGGEDDSLAERHAQCHTPGGKWYWGYGGDFDEKIHDFDFCINGMIFSDQTLPPKLHEMKRIYQPVGINFSDGDLTIQNKLFHTNLDTLEGHWTISAEGTLLAKGKLGRMEPQPGAKRSVSLRKPLDRALKKART